MYKPADIVCTRRIHGRDVKEILHLPQNLTKSPHHLFNRSIYALFVGISFTVEVRYVSCTNCLNVDGGSSPVLTSHSQ